MTFLARLFRVLAALQQRHQLGQPSSGDLELAWDEYGAPVLVRSETMEARFRQAEGR